MDTAKHTMAIAENGFTIIHDVFAVSTIDTILHIIASADDTQETFRISVYSVSHTKRHYPKDCFGLNT